MDLQNKSWLNFDNKNYYIGNYVEILFNNNLTQKGEIIDIKPNNNFIYIRIYVSRTDYSDFKIMDDEIKNIRLVSLEYTKSTT